MVPSRGLVRSNILVLHPPPTGRVAPLAGNDCRLLPYKVKVSEAKVSRFNNGGLNCVALNGGLKCVA